LDDCEIQIVSSLRSTIPTSLTKITKLEAKWYLEHQLAINRARRAQKASENAHAVNKRKLDLVTDEQNGNTEKMEENPAKRIKVQDTKESNGLVAEGTAATRTEGAEAAAIDATQNPNNEPPAQSTEAANENVEETDRPNQAAESSQPTATAPKKPPGLNTTNSTNPISTDVASQEEPKTSGPATSIDENQGFNFNSMFDDANEGGDGNNADLDFDMDLGTDAFSNVINDQNNKGPADKSASLDSLLPGFENYANQTGDEMMMNFNSSSAGAAGMDGAAAPSTNEFDLPDLVESTFDDLLNDNSFGGDMGGTGDDMLNDDSMMNLGEFDDSFFN
jgi:hypothetical protein